MLKLIEVFSRSTMTVTSSMEINAELSWSNITTYQNNPDIEPIMLAIDTYGNNVYQATLQYVQGQRKTVIPMEDCTTEHFSKIADSNKRVVQNNFARHQCLPLNWTA
jgi:acyl-CoA hydrolase